MWACGPSLHSEELQEESGDKTQPWRHLSCWIIRNRHLEKRVQGCWTSLVPPDFAGSVSVEERVANAPSFVSGTHSACRVMWGSVLTEKQVRGRCAGCGSSMEV